MRPSRSRAHAYASMAALILALGCTAPVPQEEPTHQPVGLQAIRERGVLRLLTRNNGFTYFVLRGRQLGFEYELAERFARHLGVKLQVIVPPNWGDLIPMLRAGEGDIIGASMNPTEARARVISFSQPYAMTHIRVAWGPGQQPVEGPDDLSGRQIHVRRHSSYYEYLSNLNGLFTTTGLAPVDIVLEPESLETEKILAEVSAGRIPYTLCDDYVCQEAAYYAPGLVVGPPVSSPSGLAWAVHKNAPDLLAEIDAFLSAERKNLQALYTRYYRRPKRHARLRKDESYVDAKGKVSQYDALFKEAAEKYDFDWRLLAALAYQESRFNPGAKTATAGAGLFGMVPQTARKLGAKNPNDPADATWAAAAHLSALRGEFSAVADEDSRLQFTIASFQAGPEHINDARILASKQRLDPSSWADVSKVLPLLSLREFAAQAEHGYLKGAETVAYVQEVWSRYRAYRHAFGERDAGPRRPGTAKR